MPITHQGLLIYDNYRATVAAGLTTGQTVVGVDVVPDAFNDAAAGDVAVPISILNADGDFETNAVITGWSAGDSEIYITALDWTNIAGPCTLICAPNRPTMGIKQSVQSIEGGTVSAMVSYTAEIGLTHHINVTGPGTIYLQNAPDLGTVAGYVLKDRGALTRLILLDTDADQPSVTINATIEWQDGTAPSFTVGRDMLLVELLKVDWGYIGWFRRFLAPVDPG